MSKPKTVLITGCSAGGIGDGLAQEFHRRGLRVFATARTLSKVAHLKDLGLETLPLDVTSATSIAEAVTHVSAQTDGSLDILINNSGSTHNLPITDIDLSAGKAIFDVNFFSLITVTQAFMPLLIKSGAGIVANNTSVMAVATFPFMAIYCASKSAASSLTTAMRAELRPLGVRVVELKTGLVATRFIENGVAPPLPRDSYYAAVKGDVEKVASGANVDRKQMMAVEVFARQVVGDLLGNKNAPPGVIWRGGSAGVLWFTSTFLPRGVYEYLLDRLSGMAGIEAKMKKGEKMKSV